LIHSHFKAISEKSDQQVIIATMMFVAMQLVANDGTKAWKAPVVYTKRFFGHFKGIDVGRV